MRLGNRSNGWQLLETLKNVSERKIIIKYDIMGDIFNANNPLQKLVRVHKLNDMYQATVKYEEELNKILDEDKEYRLEDLKTMRYGD